MNDEKIKNTKNFDELLDIKYGRIGSEKRDNFEEQAQYFVISACKKTLNFQVSDKKIPKTRLAKF